MLVKIVHMDTQQKAAIIVLTTGEVKHTEAQEQAVNVIDGAVAVQHRLLIHIM